MQRGRAVRFLDPVPLATGTFVTATGDQGEPHLSGTSEFSTCLEVNELINLFPSPLDLFTCDSGSLDIQLSRPGGPGDMTVNLMTSAGTIATVPTMVLIPEGELSRSVTVTTGTTAGTRRSAPPPISSTRAPVK